MLVSNLGCQWVCEKCMTKNFPSDYYITQSHDILCISMSKRSMVKIAFSFFSYLGLG